MSEPRCSTGIASLDEALGGIILGDNVVFRFSEIGMYREACRALAAEAKREGRPLHYFRFARHDPLLAEDDTITIHDTRPGRGFERFISEIHSVIRKQGLYSYYVFDLLSELSSTYFSDRMIGNFFRITCPYLRRLRTVAYFGVQRYVHSYHATDLIRGTTQVMLDLYEYEGGHYALPVKLVDRDNAPRLLRLQRLEGGRAYTVPDSNTITRVVGSTPWPGLPSASYRMIGIWDRTFLRAEEIASREPPDSRERNRAFSEALFLLTGAKERMRNLLRRYLSLEDLIRIWKRMIGTGMIGGKATGMLAAHAILKARDERWNDLIEEHDSFYIGSDVFYSFLVENDCWWYRQLQKDPKHFLDRNDQIREQLLAGHFPPYITRRIDDMLEYFGRAPIIVRSSSLLEDAFGNAFAGKYDSIFCPNQGSFEERRKQFFDAARWIYAGTMSREALEYRKDRGILDRDEQMALLVQRVSGRQHGQWFMPHAAGVGLSFNPYVWNPSIDPDAGVLRLVLGLGTRAVDISEDDFARVVALNAPRLRPEADTDAQRRYTQRQADALNLSTNRLESVEIATLLAETDDLPVSLLTRPDRSRREAFGSARRSSTPAASERLTSFDPLFDRTSFIGDMRNMLGHLEAAYGAPVDAEFTATFDENNGYSVNVVQCRPLQVKGRSVESVPLPELSPEDTLIVSNGAVIGHSRSMCIDRIVIVRPECYSELSEPRRYEVAGSLRQAVEQRHPDEVILLIGPGRWGTSTPSLGVPARFADIAGATAIMEVDVMHEGLVPDLSLGTHVFHEMVELDLLYVAHFTAGEGNVLDFDTLYALPEDGNSTLPCISVKSGRTNGCRLRLNADTRAQCCIIYWEEE